MQAGEWEGIGNNLPAVQKAEARKDADLPEWVDRLIFESLGHLGVGAKGMWRMGTVDIKVVDGVASIRMTDEQNLLHEALRAHARQEGKWHD